MGDGHHRCMLLNELDSVDNYFLKKGGILTVDILFWDKEVKLIEDNDGVYNK